MLSVLELVGADAAGDRRAASVTVTSQFTVTGILSLTSFAIVLAVGFWKHGLHSSRCSCPTARRSSSRS